MTVWMKRLYLACVIQANKPDPEPSFKNKGFMRKRGGVIAVCSGSDGSFSPRRMRKRSNADTKALNMIPRPRTTTAASAGRMKMAVEGDDVYTANVWTFIGHCTSGSNMNMAENGTVG